MVVVTMVFNIEVYGKHDDNPQLSLVFWTPISREPQRAEFMTLSFAGKTAAFVTSCSLMLCRVELLIPKTWGNPDDSVFWNDFCMTLTFTIATLYNCS